MSDIIDVPFEYDYKAVAAAADEILSIYGAPQGKRGHDSLHALSLTHRIGAKDPFSDGNNSQFDPISGRHMYSERDFCIFNEKLLSTPLYDVYARCPYTVGRVRLMLLPPFTTYQMHIDGSRRFHLPLMTNRHCYIFFESGCCHHLTPGNAYLLNTKKPHTAFNSGTSIRVHLVMSIVED